MNLPLKPAIEVRNLDLNYDDFVVMRNLNFTVNKGETFVIMGGSGCGKSTLLKVLIGLKEPDKGEILYNGEDFWSADYIRQQEIMKGFGVLYQSGALWSSLTLGENVALPLQLYSGLSASQINDLVELKLALVGLGGYADFYPAELSGGMRKRAGLARAIALDPEIVFFDEPSAGLDPISARMLDDLIIQLRADLGATIIVVTHELSSIFTVGENSIFLDAQSKAMIASGRPKDLLANSKDPKVIQFLTRGEKQGAGE
ncbi:MAG: putative ABC transporter ATP-binding protein [Candidatus Omnitrophica bacterium ADurb.Bin205]|nr:MAG: putative ABC transporter ATP-binding protein [Candidatus Omnitrophica bacterium ADurb.Bin205]